jgi:hypothetical protein
MQLCQAIERICEGHEADEVANLSPILKYLGRYGKKDRTKSVEDVEKAVWYFNRLLCLLKWKHEGAAYPDPDKEGVYLCEEDAKRWEKYKDTDLFMGDYEGCTKLPLTTKEGESVVFAVDLPKGTYVDIDYDTHQILADGKPVRWRVV